MIGDCKTVALVHMEGSIDFLCFPHFDSPSVFARLLDKDKGGYFNIQPKGEDYIIQQYYIKNTAILTTRYFSEDSTIEYMDFMPDPTDTDASSKLIRVVKAIRGTSGFDLDLQIKYDYGRASYDEVRRHSDYYIAFPCAADDCISMALKSNIPLNFKEEGTQMPFTLEEGQVAIFQFEEYDTDDLESWNHEEMGVKLWKSSPLPSIFGKTGSKPRAIRATGNIMWSGLPLP